MSFRTPMSRVIGLGSARDGVDHWWSQRVSAIALILLTPLATFPLAGLIGQDLETVRAAVGEPFTAIVLILFIAVAFRHLQLGMQVVAEDYLGGSVRVAALLANTAFCWLMGLTGVFGVAKIALAG